MGPEVPVVWERIEEGTPNTLQAQISSLARNRVGLKGATLVRLTLRSAIHSTKSWCAYLAKFTIAQRTKSAFTLHLLINADLFANIVPVASIPGLQASQRHGNTNIDFVVIRENTEGGELASTLFRSISLT